MGWRVEGGDSIPVPKRGRPCFPRGWQGPFGRTVLSTQLAVHVSQPYHSQFPNSGAGLSDAATFPREGCPVRL